MTTTPDLTTYDIILLNTSAGKDSQAMMDEVYRLAAEAGVTDRLIAVHADLGRVEWEGTRELAQKQAEQYGIRFEIVQRDGDLLQQVIDRRAALDAKGKTDAPAWPSSSARFCTSDQKTGQVTKLITRLVKESGIKGRRVRVLNCLGIRAQESPARAKKVAFGKDAANWSTVKVDGKSVKRQHGKREVDRWLPIFNWTEPQVWDRIRQSGVPSHPAYDLGMSRLSCVFCVFASKGDLTIAAKHNPELAREYVEVEIQVRSTFRADLSIAEVIEAAEPEAEPEPEVAPQTRYLTGATNAAVQAVADEYEVGLLITPDTAGLTKKGRVGGYYHKVDLHPYWAADNGAFSAKQSFTVEGWWAWLSTLAAQLTPAQRESCLFATAPDVLTWHPAYTKDGAPKLNKKGQQDVFCIGHAAPTLELLREWAPRIKELGFKVAFVAQDGLADLLDEVPWELVDVVFLGGSDDFKTGEEGALVTKRARYEGKAVHMGRVNSQKRLGLAQSWGCDTADGTFLRYGPDKNLPRLLSWLDALRPEPPAEAAAPIARVIQLRAVPATATGVVCGHCSHWVDGQRVEVRHLDKGSIRTCSLLRAA